MGGLHRDRTDDDSREAQKFLQLCAHFGLNPRKQQIINAEAGHMEAAAIWANIRSIGGDS